MKFVERYRVFNGRDSGLDFQILKRKARRSVMVAGIDLAHFLQRTKRGFHIPRLSAPIRCRMAGREQMNIRFRRADEQDRLASF